MESHSKTRRECLLLIFSLLLVQSVFGQTTYTSQGSGNFRSITWTPSIPTDFNDIADDSFIIRDGDAVVLASDISIDNLQVGQGAAATFTIGNDATGRSLSIGGSLTVLTAATLTVANNSATHTVSIAGDVVHNGATFDFAAGTDVANTTIGSAAASFVSGNAINLNDLTLNGSSSKVLSAVLTVNGAFVADGAATNVSTPTNHNFQGDFTLANGATFSATNSTQFFNGVGAQAIDVSGGSASFDNLTMSTSVKNWTGDLVSTGVLEINTEAEWINTGGSHEIAQLEIKNTVQQAVQVSNGTINFTGGEMRFGDGGNDDGSFALGTNTNLIISGTASIERDDQVTVDGNVEVTSEGQFIINGVTQFPAAGESDSELIVTGSRTLTIQANGDLYVRGYDNFPTGFATYALDANALVRYDADFDQIVKTENATNATITFGRLFLSQADASPQRSRTIDPGDDDLTLAGQLDLINGVRFDASHTVNVTFGEDLYMSDGDVAGSPVFDFQNSNVTLDADNNQVLDGPVASGYQVGQLTITNTATPSAVRRVNIDDDVAVETGFIVQNPNGSSANTIIVDVDANQILGDVGANETFTLGANCAIYSSTSAVEGFATGFSNVGDVVTIDAASIIRLDLNGDQVIPNLNGGTLGTLEFASNGNKYIPSDMGNGVSLTIQGDVTRISNTPVFRFGSISNTEQRTVNHSVAGDWNMGTAYTGDDETNGGTVEVAITFNGADQVLSASDFGDIIFDGTGTKTLTGTLLIDDDLTINDGVTVAGGAEAIDIRGDWTENGTGNYTQTGSNTEFLSGGTQTIVQNTGSSFFEVNITNNTTVDVNSTVQIGEDLNIESGSAIDIEGQTLRVSKDLRVNGGASINYTDPATSTIIFDGATEQDFRNLEASQNFPSLQFEGVGEKECFDNTLNIYGDLTIAAEATLNANSEVINFYGSNWNNGGSFLHNNDVAFRNSGGTTTVSTSSFHDIQVGDGAVTTSVLLAGNITLNGEMVITQGGTLDVSGSSYAITVEESWNNYGTFVAQNGTVTFTGGESNFRSWDGSADEPQSEKSFYNLTINLDPDARFDVEEEGVVLNDQMDVLNDLLIISGRLSVREDDGGPDPGPALVNVGGDLINQGSGFEFRQGNAKIAMVGTSGTHSIDLGGDQVRDFEINAPGATYQLTGDFLVRDATENDFVLTAGTLDLNGQTMTINRGGIEMSGGTFIIDEGASLLINDRANNPDFNKTGGDLQIIGVNGSPATISAVDDDGFTFTQSDGDIQAQYYNIASTDDDGIRIEGGTIDGLTTGNNFSNGTFTAGVGNGAYLTLANIDIGTLSASNVIFNDGPQFNVSVDGANLPNSGSIEFVIAGGTLAGVQDENDVPDGGATDGYIRWTEDNGFTWVGGSSSVWNLPANWTFNNGDADGIPDADDIIYIPAGAPNDPIIADGETFDVARVTIRSGGSLTFQGTGTLSVSGNFSVFSGCTLDMTDNPSSTLNVGGSWANAGAFNEGTATVTFNGTSGTHSITTSGNGDPFYDLLINADGATYTIGSVLTVTNSVTLTAGTLDASSGLNFNVNGDWLVNGGTFEPGQGRVRFNGAAGTQSISGGTMYDVEFQGAATKSIDGNISAADEIIFSAGTGTVLGNDRTIFIGGNWELNEASAFDPGTGTVIFNGVNQDLPDLGHDLSFYNIIFQNTGTKSIFRNTTATGDFSVISSNNVVDFEETATVTVTGTLSQTGGTLRIFNSNFPSAGSYSLTAGEVEFRRDGAQTLPANITFNDVEIRDNGGGSTTATLTGDITVQDDIVLSDGIVSFDAAGFTINLNDVFSLGNTDLLTWGAGGTLIHTGGQWIMDGDFNNTTRAFENLILNGTGLKRPQSDIAVNGDLTVGEGVELDQLAQAITNDGDGTYTMLSNAILDNRVVGLSMPSGFANYSIDVTSRVDLDANGNQTLFTNGGTIAYGELRVYSNGTVTLDGDLTVEANFDMNNDPTLSDNNAFDLTLNGANVDIRDYTPGVGRTVTFAGNQDQWIEDDDGAGLNLELHHVIFGGSGTKTLDPNADDEVIDINGDVTINSGVTVTTNNGMQFSGSTFTNDGTFTLTATNRPFVFDGGNATITPGDNEIAALTVSNSTATTVTVSTNGLDLGNGNMVISADAAIDFSGLSHTLASENVNIDATGLWIVSNATLDFDQTGGQNVPIIDEGNANVTGIPHVLFSGTGNKLLTGPIVVDDLTIGGSVDLDVDNTSSYQVTVNGSWDNLGGDFLEREGTAVFNAATTTAKTINPNGEDFAAVTFQGTAVRTYSLQGDMQIEGNTAGTGLTLTSATLDLNGQVLTLGDDDAGDPDAETNIIGTNGTLEVDAGATLQFNASDDGGDVTDTEIGGNLDVQSGGVLNVVGNATQVANITRSQGGNRIDINIESGGEIGAQYYTMQYLTDEGLEVEDGATINATNNFSNGTFSNLDTDAGDGTGGDDNPATGNAYLNLEADAAMTISNVVFNFGGTPNVGEHFNVRRSNDVSNSTIDFDNTSGPLGRSGATYEDDGDPTTPAESNGQLTWELPVDTRWVGTTSTDWNTGSNWDNGVPSIAINDREAVIALGQPFNPVIDGLSVNISALVLEDGLLKVVNASSLDVDGDITLGDGSGGALTMDNTSSVLVEGSWSTANNAIFDGATGTVTFNAASGNTVSISPGNQSFANLIFTHPTAAGEFNLIDGNLDIVGNLTIEQSALLVPSTNNYEYRITGDINGTGGEFDTTVDGEIILNGGNQLLTNMSFDELTASGSGTKTTAGTTTINDVFEIEAGVMLSGGGDITFEGDVSISGTFNGVASRTYTFSGDDWIAVANSYTGDGTVEFNRAAGNQYIRQMNAGDFPVEFHNLTLSGNSNIELGRLIGGIQYEGNVDVTGNMTVNNTINILEVFDYLIDNTSGTGTFTLAANEIIDIDGADHFPVNFATYDLDDNSTTRYWGTIDQVIRGITYGNVDLDNTSIKTLGGNVDIDGNLTFRDATLDASVNDYSINLAGRWDTNNGNEDGEFIARNGTVTFDGAVNQTLDLGETRTQSFNNVFVNKSGGNVEVTVSNMTILGDINVFSGTFDINGLQASIAGNMNATGTGIYSGTGLYLLNATSGSPTIGTNNSVIAGSMEVNAAGRTYELVSDLTLLNNLTISAGTLDVNGQTLSVGDAEDVVGVFGTLNVSTTDKPGGTLALGNDVQVVVNPGASFSLVGTSSQPARMTSTGTTDYRFTATGTVGNESTVSAQYYVVEYIGSEGLFVNTNTNIDLTDNFSNGSFQNGFAGGRYLRIENTQNLIGADRIENLVFDDNPGGGASNIYKTTSSGAIEVFNYSGGFAGEDFDEDPNDLVTWIQPPTVTWTGAVSTDWFTAGNWDTNTVPTSTQNVVIPQTLNEPIIVDNASVAEAQSLTLAINSRLVVDTDDLADVDLRVGEDLTFEASASLISRGNDDDIEIGGSWIRLTNALFTPGTSEVTFTSTVGAETIDNSNSFYDLEVNTVGLVSLAADLRVSNDFALTGGSLDLLSFDLTVGGNFTNAGTINARSQTVSLIPDDATLRTFNPGTSEFYNIVIGEAAGSAAEYDLAGDLILNHDFSLLAGTLDPNSFNVTIGNNDGQQDDVIIAATLTLEGNEAVFFGDDAYVSVQNGGSLTLNGTDASNVARLTRRTSGDFEMVVENGGTFGADFFLVEYLTGEGLHLQSGATLTGLSNGTFQNGTGTQYIRLSNDLGTDLTAADVDFNTGPTYNVRRNEGAGSNIILQDAGGAFSGPTFELDDGVAGTGEVRWTYSDPLSTWDGSEGTDWADANNWTPPGVPQDNAPGPGNTVHIPGGLSNYPVISGSAAEAVSLTIFSGATLTIDAGQSLSVEEDLVNSGTLTVTGASAISAGGSWTNLGTFTAGTSTVTLNCGTDITVSGGLSFYNLTIDATGVGSGATFTTTSDLTVQNDFNVADGNFEVTDAAHTVTIGGHLSVDATNGSFVDNLSTVLFNGTNQNIGSASGATLTFNNVSVSGGGTKTVNDPLDIGGQLSIASGSDLSLANQSVSFGGASLVIDGGLTSGGTSQFTFDGAQIQVITGSAASAAFDNMVINNTAPGNNDLQLNIDVTSNTGINFIEGIVQSSSSNTLTFADNATVSYDGVADAFPIGAAPDDNSFVVGPVVKVGDDEFIFPIGEGTRLARLGVSNLDNGGAVVLTATDRLRAEYFFTGSANTSAPKTGGIERVSGLEYWDLSRESGAAQPQVTLFYDEVSQVNDPSSLVVGHYTGGNWINEAGTAVGSPTGYITSINWLTFSETTLATTNAATNPLPVELLDFYGEIVDERVSLHWQTASELNNDYFLVERSANGEDFEAIGTVEGAGTTEQQNVYTFTDDRPDRGENFYRLTQVDFDGESEVLGTVRLLLSAHGEELSTSIYPNPSSTAALQLVISTHNTMTPIQLRVLDLTGQPVFIERIDGPERINELRSPLPHLSDGVYLVEVVQGPLRHRSKLIIRN